MPSLLPTTSCCAPPTSKPSSAPIDFCSTCDCPLLRQVLSHLQHLVLIHPNYQLLSHLMLHAQFHAVWITICCSEYFYCSTRFSAMCYAKCAAISKYGAICACMRVWNRRAKFRSWMPSYNLSLESSAVPSSHSPSSVPSSSPSVSECV
jgi:hypothetical protein